MPSSPVSTRTSGRLPDVENPMPHVLCEGANAQPLDSIGVTATDKLVIVMVGLPATGKTHTANRIRRFLEFFHDIPCSIFNVGDYRRKICGTKMPASFYDVENKDGVAARKVACDAALADLVMYMKIPGVRVGILDATNSTASRRKYVKETLVAEELGVKVMCIESVCNDNKLLAENIRSVKINTPDYKEVDPDEAVKDFEQRRNNYKKTYEGITEQDGPYVIIHDCKKFVINKIRGYLPLKVVHFVMNLHTMPRVMYFTRHGQSEYNTLGKIGGDSGLSKYGLEYAKRLAVYARDNICRSNDPVTGEFIEKPARLWTSTMRRTKETGQFIEHPDMKVKFDEFDELSKHDWIQMRPMARRNLDELYAGVCDGMTYKEIEEIYPEEFEARQDDKLAYRYPKGESYMDVIQRLEPLAHEMERCSEPLLIIGHQGILRILYAYFMGLSRADAPYVSIPLNHVLKLKPHAYGCHEERICLMTKKEMLMDGQDEPITSMPKGSRVSPPPATPAHNDPIMNAPSC